MGIDPSIAFGSVVDLISALFGLLKLCGRY